MFTRLISINKKALAGKKLQGLSTAYGIRTRATAVKGRRPKPLDERGISVNSVSMISDQ